MNKRLQRGIWLGLVFSFLLGIGGFMNKEELSVSTQGGDVQISGQESVELRKVALTFDDGPSFKYTISLLDGLRERNVKASFFLMGQKVAEYPEIVKRMAGDGHLIGNHSFYHNDLSKLSKEEAIREIALTNEVIYEVTGEYPQFIRPPFGKGAENVIYEPPMLEVLWNVDSRDWELNDVGVVMENVLPYVEDNSIILMHDSSASSVQAALAIVDTLKEQGYSFVTVEEILFD